MFAILELGGKQYLVKEKDILRVEQIKEETGKTTKADKVLLFSSGAEVKVGTPYLSSASVSLKVLGSGRGDKVRIFKMKAKKRYKKLRGHRQPYTDVQVEKISA